jgi:ankyrin repeat protein
MNEELEPTRNIIWEIEEAAKAGELDVVKKLHADYPEESRYGWSAITKAVHAGQLNVVIYLCGQGYFKPGSLDYELCFAAENGHLDIVKFLHETCGRSVLGRENDRMNGFSPISAAAANGHIEIVKYLHKKGASVKGDNNRAIKSAWNFEHEEIVKYLMNAGADILTVGNRKDMHSWLPPRSSNTEK